MINSEFLTVIVVSGQTKQTFEVDWIEIEAPNGSFVVCPGHFNLVSQIKNNSEILLKNRSGAVSALQIPCGLLLVQDGHLATVMIFNN